MKEKKHIDFMSRFICTVYKPIYSLIIPLIFALIIDLTTSVDFNIDITLLYWFILIATSSIILLSYVVCRIIRKKNRSLNENQLTVIEKIKGLALSVTVTLVLMVVVPLVHVYIISML